MAEHLVVGTKGAGLGTELDPQRTFWTRSFRCLTCWWRQEAGAYVSLELSKEVGARDVRLECWHVDDG